MALFVFWFGLVCFVDIIFGFIVVSMTVCFMDFIDCFIVYYMVDSFVFDVGFIYSGYFWLIQQDVALLFLW